ncbi:MAG: response regulator transcription factor [bacterium]
MKRTVFIYGALLAILVVLLRVLEYRFFVRELSIEIYVGLVALLFTALGIWIGLKIIDRQKSKARFQDGLDGLVVHSEKLKSYGISERELEVLELMAKGYSNQEIANKLFVSLHTIKTHCSNLYSKLDVNRRTQAIQKAREISATE